MKKSKDPIPTIILTNGCEKDDSEDHLKLLQSLLRQRTKQLEIFGKETAEQRKQVIKKNHIISEYESLYENLRQSKDKEIKLLKDELVYRNNVIKSQLQTMEKLRLRVRKMDSLLPLNQYEAIEENEEQPQNKSRARAKGISAEPRSVKSGIVLKTNIEDFFFQKRQRFVYYAYSGTSI